MGLGDDLFIGRHEWKNIDKNQLPKDIPEVDEVGATSAPLLSASYFIGAKCKPYNDDFMLCKDEKNGGTLECLKEGRRVTRCAISVLKDINKYCFDEFKLHYECLEQENHRLGNCRSSEKLLNKCVFNNLKLEKKIPGVENQIHLNENPIYTGFGKDKSNVQEFLKSKPDSSESS
ncbi:NADH dehydrogenase, alpha subcomplex, subunit 8 [Hyphopichia burtonii NRRL Y-1933]|uniref:NADH-ubiquinone oxidoreductase n=1 Tax=Hyphopichia burtonii NRRL Y-1933 TaxID=984485 RepID=A0A1E4RDI0_9ASCO|nr:NADH dehydrogenase, alpha subcomplex, subunit 8 [Hyphopichia burtonii NRRL Y-1933]ODV65324.1 NADH dehydrogenase, alpha subcomplex, subunit 8 [Hyphopichia burtonii NRRL Y-1933]